MKTHTPTPYRVVTNNFKEYKGMYEEGMNIETDDTIICSISGGMPIYEAESNAQFIITACNSHDQLVEALKHIVCVVDCNASEYLQEALNNAREAISKAEGKE